MIGLAQACALAPGVSRNGATLAAARWRGFKRRDANVISRQIALPVIVGASILKGGRLVARRDLPEGVGRGMLAGAGAAFASTLLSMRLIGMLERARARFCHTPRIERSWRLIVLGAPAAARGAASPLSWPPTGRDQRRSRVPAAVQ